MIVARFDILLVALDPTRGSEIQKTRPCVVVSPDEVNRRLRTVLIVPMTTGGQLYPTRIPITFGGTKGHIALDQMRAVAHERVVRRLGRLDVETAGAVLDRLQALSAR